MVCHCSAIILILVPVLANIGRAVGFVSAPTTGTVTKELSHGATRELSSEKQLRAGKRDSVYLTGQNCASTCGGVAGSGPNQTDCNQIIDALSKNTATFTVEPYSVASWVQASCTVEFVQSTEDTITYSYINLGTIAAYLSDACNAANGYAYGRCIFDGREDAIWVGNTADSSQTT